jgi:hypothetical protein
MKAFEGCIKDGRLQLLVLLLAGEDTFTFTKDSNESSSTTSLERLDLLSNHRKF